MRIGVNTGNSTVGVETVEADGAVVEDERSSGARRPVVAVESEPLTEPSWPERGPRPGGGAAWA